MIKSSDILIIGGGVSSIFPILLGKRRVTLIEKGKLFSRILVAGNGRCNFFNEKILDEDDENLKLFLKEEEKNYPFQVLKYIKEELDISYYVDNGYYYPFFNKSECFYNPLLEKVNRSGYSLLKGEAISIDYKNKIVSYKNDNDTIKIFYNKLIISTGGFSYLYNQSYSLLDSLNVKINRFSPSLCPIKVKEKIPNYLVGLRLKGTVYLKVDGKIEFKEEGEILFKKDGLSGIVIFNASKKINELNKKNIIIEIDYSFHDGYKNTSISSLPSSFKKYLEENHYKVNDNLIFSFSELYSFKESQASYGGISLDEIDLGRLCLKKYPDIYAIGEVIDLNFSCGGFNIGYNMIEGYKVIEEILGETK